MYSLINKIKENQTLNFNDIEFILQYTKQHINNKNILKKILEILNKDIKLRKEKFNIDCFKELKKEKLLFPLRIQYLLEKKFKTKIELIVLKLTAILYYEYTRLVEEIGDKFIQKQITYEEYENKMKEYDINFLKLLFLILLT
jgi:hypothetical protein